MNRFYRSKSLAILVAFAVLASGCSTVFGRHQDDQMVTFDANVSGVEVNCSGKRVDTPGSMPLRQSKSHACIAEKSGYEKKAFRIRSASSWSGFGHSTATNTAIWGWWTLGIGTGIGWLVDWPSGAMRDLKEDEIYIEMKEEGSSGAAARAGSAAVNIGKVVVNAPIDAVQGTTTAILDSAVHDGAKQLGVSTEEDTASS